MNDTQRKKIYASIIELIKEKNLTELSQLEYEKLRAYLEINYGFSHENAKNFLKNLVLLEVIKIKRQ